MSKFIIAGSTGVIKSSKALEEIKLLEKYRPSSLVLTEGEGESKREVFRVGTAASASVNQFGISFANSSLTGDGKAVVTVALPADLKPENVTDYVMDKWGKVINNLNKVEQNFEDALTDVKAEQAEVLSHITVAEE